MQISLLNIALSRIGAIGFNPISLFAAGEQGAWYDPSDFSTMFQDAAGTIPVTAVGQPVGLMLDKSKGLVLGPERVTNGDFSNGANGWAAIGSATLSVIGGTASVTVAGTSGGIVSSGQSLGLTVGSVYQVSFDLDISAMSAGGVEFRVAGVGVGIAIITTSGSKKAIFFAPSNNPTISVQRVGGAVGTFTIDNISVRELPGNHATQTTDTKRPVLQQDANGKYYLLFDGIDDALQTASVNFTGTDKVTVWAGVRKLSDVASGLLVELSINASTTSGSFVLLAPSSNGANSYRFFSRGTAGPLASAGNGTFAAAPDTAVITAIGEITPAVQTIRRNAAQVETISISQGTGNYGDYPLYIGSRGGTSIPFNGRLYSLIIRGAQSTAAQITNTENYVNSKTQAY